MIATTTPTGVSTDNIATLENQEIILDYLRGIYDNVSAIEFDKNFDWKLFFDIRRTGELFSTKFFNYSTTSSGTGEAMYDSIGLTCTPSTEKERNQDDFANHNAFWYVRCNFTVTDDGVKVPTAIEGQDKFTAVGKVDVGVLTPPLYYGEEKVDDGYIKHFSDSPHPSKRPDLNLTLMPHCKDNKGNPMPYGIVPVYYAGEIEGVLYGSSGLTVKNFMSYENLHAAMEKKGKGWVGAGSERSAYLKNFLWIKYRTLNSQTVFKGCTNYNFQYKAVKGESNVKSIIVTKANANNIIIGHEVSIGFPGTSGTVTDRGQANMRKYADLVRVTKKEDIDDGANTRVYVDASNTFTTTTDTYISSMPLHSGMTDAVLGHDGYAVNDDKHPFKIQGVEDGIGAYMVSSNEMFDKETTVKTVLYNRKWLGYTTDQATVRNSWKKIVEFTNPDSAGADFWIGEETFDPETGSTFVSVKGDGDSKGVGDRYYFGANNLNLREYLTRGILWDGLGAGLSCVYSGRVPSSAGWFFAACVS